MGLHFLMLRRAMQEQKQFPEYSMYVKHCLVEPHTNPIHRKAMRAREMECHAKRGLVNFCSDLKTKNPSQKFLQN